MERLRPYHPLIALPLVAIMVLHVLSRGTAQAEMISTEQVIAGQATARTGAEAREHVLRLLQRTELQAEMRALGVDPAEAAERVRAMTDSEVQHVAGRLHTLPAGGDSLTTGLVLGLLAALAFALVVGTLVYFAFSSFSDDSQSPPPRSN